MELCFSWASETYKSVEASKERSEDRCSRRKRGWEDDSVEDIMGETKLDSGKTDVRPGYRFTTRTRSLDFELTPVEQIRSLKPRMEYGDIRAMLGQFQFTKDMVSTKLGTSGGERARITC